MLHPRSNSAALDTRHVQAIYPKIQAFVDDFHSGKAAGHNENAAANKPVVGHNAGQQAGAAKPEVKKDVAGKEQSKKKVATTAAGIKRGSNRIEFKETFFCCVLPLLHACIQHHAPLGFLCGSFVWLQ